MLFFTILFISYYMIGLFDGNPVYNDLQKYSTISLNIDDNFNKESTIIGIKIIIKAALRLLMDFIMFIYLMYALRVDIYKYPTIIILLSFILNTFISFGKQNKKTYNLEIELSKEEFFNDLSKIKKYSIKNILSNMVHLLYFGYMFYLIVF